MPEQTNAARAAEILRTIGLDPDINPISAEIITAALDEARRTALEEAELAIRHCSALDENGYICEKAKAIASLRALLDPRPAAQPEGDR